MKTVCLIESTEYNKNESYQNATMTKDALLFYILQVKLKDYKNGHENSFCFSVVLELKVKKGNILTFKVIFYVKNCPNLYEKKIH